jgi:membrane-associated phospholipid phosphatase
MIQKSKLLVRGWIFMLLTLLFALTLIGVSLYYDKGHMVLWFAEYRSDGWNIFFLAATRLGEVHIYLLAIFIFLFIAYRKSAMFSLAGIMSLVTAFIAKSIFLQPRPYKYFSELDQATFMGKIDGYEFHSAMTSMPSGHTIAAFSFFFLLSTIGKKKYWQLAGFLFAALGGISRIYLGQHFSADVALGSIIGTAIGFLSYYMAEEIWKDNVVLDRSVLKVK